MITASLVAGQRNPRPPGETVPATFALHQTVASSSANRPPADGHRRRELGTQRAARFTCTAPRRRRFLNSCRRKRPQRRNPDARNRRDPPWLAPPRLATGAATAALAQAPNTPRVTAAHAQGPSGRDGR